MVAALILGEIDLYALAHSVGAGIALVVAVLFVLAAIIREEG